MRTGERHLVTGGSGFIGTHLVEDLLREGAEVVNVDIAAPKLAPHRAAWRRLDILDNESLRRTFLEVGPTHVTHLAARTDTDSDRVEDYRVNTDGTGNVLAATAATPGVLRLVITSTQFVHQYADGPKDDLDFAPHTAYGESKVITEKLTRAANLACTWTIVRPTNIWGPWHKRYPYEFWRVLGRGRYLHPASATPVIRAYGYVRNVTHQILEIFSASSDVVAERVFYLGDEPIDLRDWVDGFARAQRGRPARVIPARIVGGLARCGDALARIGVRFPLTSSRFRSMTTSNPVDMSRTFTALGPSPYTLEAGIAETVGWLRAHHPDLVRA